MKYIWTIISIVLMLECAFADPRLQLKLRPAVNIEVEPDYPKPKYPKKSSTYIPANKTNSNINSSHYNSNNSSNNNSNLQSNQKYYVSDKDVDYEIEYLRHRVHNLEVAVKQLQETVFQKMQNEINQLKQQALTKQEQKPQKNIHVYLKTPFNGTFFGKGSTKIEAYAEVLKQCEQAGGNIHCNESKIKSTQ